MATLVGLIAVGLLDQALPPALTTEVLLLALAAAPIELIAVALLELIGTAGGAFAERSLLALAAALIVLVVVPIAWLLRHDLLDRRPVVRGLPLVVIPSVVLVPEVVV